MKLIDDLMFNKTYKELYMKDISRQIKEQRMIRQSIFNNKYSIWRDYNIIKVILWRKLEKEIRVIN